MGFHVIVLLLILNLLHVQSPTDYNKVHMLVQGLTDACELRSKCMNMVKQVQHILMKQANVMKNMNLQLCCLINEYYV